MSLTMEKSKRTVSEGQNDIDDRKNYDRPKFQTLDETFDV